MNNNDIEDILKEIKDVLKDIKWGIDETNDHLRAIRRHNGWENNPWIDDDI